MKWYKYQEEGQNYAYAYVEPIKGNDIGFYCYYDRVNDKYLCCWYMDPTNRDSFCFVNKNGLCTKKFDYSKNVELPHNSFLYDTLNQAIKSANRFARQIQFRN